MACNVLSFDTSTNATGWALFTDGKYVRSGCINLKDEKDVDTRMRKMVELIYQIIRSVDVDIIYAETPKQGNNQDALRKLSMIIGSIMGYCISHDIYYEEFAPSVWRKYVKRDGETLPRKRAELKQWSKDRVCEIYGVDVSDDEADAIMIATSAIKRYTN